MPHLLPLVGEVRIVRSDCLELEEAAQTVHPVDVDAHVLPEEEPPAFGHHHPYSKALRECRLDPLCVLDLDDPVAAQPLPHFIGTDIRDQVASGVLFLSQLEATGGDVEVGVSLYQLTTI